MSHVFHVFLCLSILVRHMRRGNWAIIGRLRDVATADLGNVILGWARSPVGFPEAISVAINELVKAFDAPPPDKLKIARLVIFGFHRSLIGWRVPASLRC